MAKPKREWIRTEMIERLRRNRDGRLTPSQWLSITSEPLTTMLLLLAPALLIIGLRLPFLAARLWLVIPIVLLVLGAMLFLRARRFARAPLHAHKLQAGPQPILPRLLGQTTVLQDDEGTTYRFKSWLAPRIPLRTHQVYRVYALEDGDRQVLCSLIPADDPEAAAYEPSAEFRRRMRQTGV